MGYADSSGAAAYNVSLSQNRALAVYNALQNRFDSPGYSMLSYKGGSVAMPEMWMNRRVQISACQSPSQAINKDTAANTDTIRAFDLEYIYFVPDKAIVTQESVPYIQELATRLQTYKTETFEIVGHVNYQSRFDSSHLRDLYRLSEQRAKAVYDYLLEFGIPETKMEFKGVGNAQPVYPLPVNDAQKRKNMRVQIIIKKQ